jgi:hypothetical protein
MRMAAPAGTAMRFASSKANAEAVRRAPGVVVMVQQTVWSQPILHIVLAGSGNALQPIWQIVHAMPDASMPAFSMAALLTLRMTGGD